jgi:UDP-N-acetylglucosamine/UDP-N-acetylgalactosamine diphosphorylase
LSWVDFVSSVEQLGQGHLLRFWNELPPQSQESLRKQVEQIDLVRLQELVQGKDQRVDFEDLASRAIAPPAVLADGSGARWSAVEARDAGQAALREGKLGMILVAGGQGSRLGFDRPKGLFPIGPLSQRTLFQMHLDRLAAVGCYYGRAIPLYVMTSPATHEETIDYLERNHWLGWSRELLRVFCQGVMPAVEFPSGKIILEAKDRIALSPDGHGGLLNALAQNGCLQHAKELGVEQFYYAQVDNPLVASCDPVVVGHHLLAQSDMTTQVVRKRHALERVGNVVSIDGRVQIIEYSDLPESAAKRLLPDGSLALWAGNIAVHVFQGAFLDRTISLGNQLPFHRAYKKISTLDDQGKPQQVDGVKFERFIFDLLPLASNALAIEGKGEDAFAPVKNAEGAEGDTPTHARQAILAQHRRWLESAGAVIAPQVDVEIHPRLGFDERTVAERMPKGLDVRKTTYFEFSF